MIEPEAIENDSSIDSLHHAQIRFEELEGVWRNLKQTVPPHAQDWWDENMERHQARIDPLREKFHHMDKPRWGDSRKAMLGELNALELIVEEARVGLGERTVAGRARSK